MHSVRVCRSGIRQGIEANLFCYLSLAPEMIDERRHLATVRHRHVVRSTVGIEKIANFHSVSSYQQRRTIRCTIQGFGN